LSKLTILKKYSPEVALAVGKSSSKNPPIRGGKIEANMKQTNRSNSSKNIKYWSASTDQAHDLGHKKTPTDISMRV
jgi:hypothetical protein